jgi:AdoMet-dependent heme synthase
MEIAPFENLIESIRTEIVPFSAVWEVTNRCNLRCVHCYQGKEGTELDRERSRAMLDDLLALGCLKLTLTGGEPLLHPDFREIYEYCTDKGFAVTLFTNATRFSPGLMDLLLRLPPFAVECSLHGASAPAHDAVTGVEGSFEAAKKNILQLVEKGFRVVVKSALMSVNHQELGPLRELTRQWDASFHPTLRIFPKIEKGASVNSLRVGDDVLKRLCASGYLPDLTSEGEPDPNSREFLCNAGRQACCISAEGKVYPCVAFRWECGDLRDRSLAEIWSDSPALATLRGYREEDFEECGRCRWKRVCEFCPGMGYGEQGNALVPCAELCRLTRAMHPEPPPCPPDACL